MVIRLRACAHELAGLAHGTAVLCLFCLNPGIFLEVINNDLSHN